MLSDLVKGHGQRWPRGWVKGEGIRRAGRVLGADSEKFSVYAHAYVQTIRPRIRSGFSSGLMPPTVRASTVDFSLTGREPEKSKTLSPCPPSGLVFASGSPDGARWPEWKSAWTCPRWTEPCRVEGDHRFANRMPERGAEGHAYLLVGVKARALHGIATDDVEMMGKAASGWGRGPAGGGEARPAPRPHLCPEVMA